MNASAPHSADATLIRRLVEDWARAVRDKDYDGILARHGEDILMFDVPPPFVSRGLAAYRASWDLFFSSQPQPVAFDFRTLDIVAGADVAFVTATMQCAELNAAGARIPLDFRLTMGLRKLAQGWTIVHEHHSIPAA